MQLNSLLAARRTFSNWGVWPVQPSGINPEGWLRNFEPDDVPIAQSLLESFLFFSTKHTAQLFVGAVRAIAPKLSIEGGRRGKAWSDFIANAVVTFPADEDQNPSDSGHIFTRVARYDLGFPNANLYRPSEAVKYLAKLHEPVPLLVVDDFMGSCQQITDTWRMPVDIGSRVTTLAEQVDRLKVSDAFVAVAVTTAESKVTLLDEAPEIQVSAAHVLSGEYSARDTATVLVADEYRADLDDFLRRYTEKSGLPASRRYGFRELGLAVAFEHSVPDATLPIFWNESETWLPLRRRGQ